MNYSYFHRFVQLYAHTVHHICVFYYTEDNIMKSFNRELLFSITTNKSNPFSRRAIRNGNDNVSQRKYITQQFIEKLRLSVDKLEHKIAQIQS